MLLAIGAVAADKWKCPNGWNYNTVTKECDPKKASPPCKQGTFFNPSTKQCDIVCPPDWAWDAINGCYVPGEFHMNIRAFLFVEKEANRDVIAYRLSS